MSPRQGPGARRLRGGDRGGPFHHVMTRVRIMAESIHTFTTIVSDGRGRYRVHVEGERTSSGTWHGWLAFEPLSGSGGWLRTGRETTQSDRDDLEYWASGLEPLYLEGALDRAH